MSLVVFFVESLGLSMGKTTLPFKTLGNNAFVSNFDHAIFLKQSDVILKYFGEAQKVNLLRNF